MNERDQVFGVAGALAYVEEKGGLIRTKPTLIKWGRVHGWARKVEHRWVFDKQGIDLFLGILKERNGKKESPHTA